MKIRTRNFRKDREVANFWPSFTDVMATIALVLFFLMLLAYIQYIIAGKNLATAGQNLEYLRKELDDTNLQLESSKAEINQAKNELRLLMNEIEDTKAEVERGKLELKLSREEIDKQQQIIADSNQELAQLREKLQSIAVLRVDILTKVKESIESEIGRTNDRGEPLVTVSENANLVVNESLLFEFGSSEISWEGKLLLEQFAVAFEKILDDKSIRDFIDAIHIEGHADNIGSPDSNMKLSSQRAYNVVNYILESNTDLEGKQYGEYFAASGFSEFRPIDTGDSEQARKRNRRIEISINIKDSNIQKIINDYLGLQ